jgi:uncharacterized metal-binding protein YceD (DUF177 family)
MLLRLETIDPGKPLIRELELSRETIKTVTGDVEVRDVRAVLRFQTDPSGYITHYEIKALVEMSCIRCSGLISEEITTSDWVSLRTRQPRESHIVLASTEMNIRFLEQPELDLNRFVLETIELEISDYPRHEEGHPSCLEPMGSKDPDPEKSPFDSLSEFLN